MTRKFRSVILDLGNASDCQVYEDIKQDAVIDKAGRYEVVSEAAHWDVKSGSRLVHIDYIEDDGAEDVERY